MTVSELIDKLKDIHPEANVLMRIRLDIGNGYCMSDVEGIECIWTGEDDTTVYLVGP